MMLNQCIYFFQTMKGDDAISKTLLYLCKDPTKSRFHLLQPTVISIENIGGATIHSCLRINPATKLFGLIDKSKTALRNMLSEVKFLIIDLLSMIYNLCIKWFMKRFWIKIGRNTGDDSWKSICWSFSFDLSWFASTTSNQRKTNIPLISWKR